MKTSATNRKLRLLLTGIQNGVLIPRPEFQRRLVWSNKHKLEFLKTVLEGYPFPEIYIAAGDVDSETGEGNEMLVDGQQRITTLYQYFKSSDDLKLDKMTKPYRELEEAEKIAFLEYEVVVRDLGKLPIPEILEIFRRINSTNYALNAMEIHNARFDGEFKQFGEEIAEHQFFSDSRFFTPQEIKRMGDTRFCLILLCTLMSGYSNRDDVLEKYLENYNETFEHQDKLRSEFNRVAEFITNCSFDQKSRVWKKADLFTLFVEVHRYLFKREVQIDETGAATALKSFYNDVDSIIDPNDTSNHAGIYYKAALQATNDRGNRLKRGEIIQKVLDSTYNPRIEIIPET
ncbi:MAG: DUF262 domain-containing protein [Proteobacteria bacterium]|nr:DUF262 domain-containing protein [Pseudomonadota bacterium]MBU1582009.1 DUF262 domain-containing protein [Pseudomonadota bacterium]